MLIANSYKILQALRTMWMPRGKCHAAAVLVTWIIGEDATSDSNRKGQNSLIKTYDIYDTDCPLLPQPVS
jgi:hypothetical protein